jgi:hypothetical protein
MGSDPAVREALWGIAPTFPEDSLFYQEIRKIAAVRDEEAALRYGRVYFRPVSGDSNNFGVSPFPGGIFAWSRILNDQEVVVAANTNSALTQSVDVILERLLSASGDRFRILYSNNPEAIAPAPVNSLIEVSVAEVDGTTGRGPVNTLRVTLGPMEVQILRR